MKVPSVVFETKGLIDVRAFTTFGLNAKPNTENPIGYFGTGLKFAVAVLVRENIPFVVDIGLKSYNFSADTDSFRDKEFTFISMMEITWTWIDSLRSLIAEGSKHQQLPFTTELGKNWELWMAFRELESNTRDENGETWVTKQEDDTLPPPEDNVTRIIVTGEAFAKVFEDRDKYFLPDGLRVKEEFKELQVLERPSEYVYYRGLNVHKLKKPAMFTYNILCDIDLTEDRTIKYSHEVDRIISHNVLTSEDEKFVQTCVTSPHQYYERELDFSFVYRPPSTTFKKVVNDLPRAHVSHNAYTYARQHEPKIDHFLLAGIIRPVKWKDVYLIDDVNKALMVFMIDVSDETKNAFVKAINDYEF